MSDDFDDEAEGPDDDGDATVPTDAFAAQRQRVADMGGFMLEMEHHVLTWLPGRGERLVVSFDNLAAVRETEDRQIWGQGFLPAQGYDLLGLQIKRRDWYRDAQTIRALEDLRDDGFFRRFPAVSMYGSSMGGFRCAGLCATRPRLHGHGACAAAQPRPDPLPL